MFIATYYFVKALKKSNKKNVILAGLAFGGAMLCKFSVVLLVPFFGLIAIVWGIK
ncbi:unnamed protein product [marine sediment metagenome]|uniref:Glycosyltransferase RgtA/B/C/D-like domain-containing protein n=1 Tax=marine sediment metagenome TaxID=412755 RepID=X1L0T9_9ZZZZ